jgi:double zinc ribbon protein
VEHDQRDRRESDDADDASSTPPDSTPPSSADEEVTPDQPAHAPTAAWTPDSSLPPTDEAAATSEPVETDEPTPDAGSTPSEGIATSEIESWPSQEATRAEGTEATTAASTDAPAWPTEPPAAGSADPDAWPTEPPERGDEPIREPQWSEPVGAEAETAESPPSEVEAYPAAVSPEAADDAGTGAAAVTAAHTVPAGEGATGESTQCPRCGTENRPGLAFCRNCGQRLVAAGVATTVERPGATEGTMACPRCGTHNRTGVAFCQNCGANLRGTAAGYVPPAVEGEAPAEQVEVRRGGAVLGPVVLLIGLVGVVTGYLLPFLYGSGSLFERASRSDGYGVAFWSAYPDVGAVLADQAYFGLTGPIPLLGVLLLVLAVAGFVRARPGPLQAIGLGIALLWSVGLIVLFVVVEVLGNWDGDLVGLLRVLTPAGIIFFLSSLIILIGTLTRFGRS